MNKPNRPVIPPHGGYDKLRCYKLALIVYDGTAVFCRRFISGRTVDQMTQAARSGKQNIAEGSRVSGTSKKSEMYLMGVARASLEELLVDYKEFLRQGGMELWDKDHQKSEFIRKLHKRINLMSPPDLSNPSDR